MNAVGSGGPAVGLSGLAEIDEADDAFAAETVVALDRRETAQPPESFRERRNRLPFYLVQWVRSLISARPLRFMANPKALLQDARPILRRFM